MAPPGLIVNMRLRKKLLGSDKHASLLLAGVSKTIKRIILLNPGKRALTEAIIALKE